ncbi:MAG: cobyric acid synthase [Cellulosilyticaceae bacterium]
MTKAIMVQGTMSNSGKSFITAGLCRIFKQDGYKVAPFKSQNMALNSFITEEGLEMGRAQVMQAEAAGIKPDVRMNPILLKPTSDKGSQVILHGEVLGNVSAKDYFTNKKGLAEEVMKAYNQLAEDFDIIVIEGAGSPAEINLQKDDIVNMGMAEMAKAPVLLVADIDRGDVNLLTPGLKMIEDITHVPVVGVLPFLKVEVDDEDSLSTKLDHVKGPALIDIAVMRLPRLSNFTDFNPLEFIEGVNVRYVRTVQELKTPDMIILPGTKNTIHDLMWLRESGLEASILKHAAKGGAVFGICGGYQMLGEMLEDPHGVEGGGSIRGMGLLKTKTVFEEEKTRTQVAGKFKEVQGILSHLTGKTFEGYEIHMGQTTGSEKPLTTLETILGEVEERHDGAYADNVYGSYIHGLFDQEEVAKAVVTSLLAAKGLEYSDIQGVDIAAYKEEQYDKLAEGLREHLDMKKIYDILEQGL